MFIIIKEKYSFSENILVHDAKRNCVDVVSFMDVIGINSSLVIGTLTKIFEFGWVIKREHAANTRDDPRVVFDD